jgi:head-tail adaptor
MRAGNAYHRIDFYAKVITRDDYNASVVTYPLITISTRGEIRYSGGSKSLDNEERFYSKSMELTVRYRSEIVETMRLKIDGGDEWYEITYIEPLGRNQDLRMTLEKINT